MGFRGCLLSSSFLILVAPGTLLAQAQSSSPSPKHANKPAAADSGIDSGFVTNGVYRNKALGLACKIPAGWVLRTEEMNAGEDGAAEKDADAKSENSAKAGSPEPAAKSESSRSAVDRTAPSTALRAGLGGCPHIDPFSCFFLRKFQGNELGRVVA